MKIQILEYNEDEEMTIEIHGEGHTFTNVIREFISDTKDVDSAGYHKEHPFIEKAKLVVKAAPKKKLDKVIRTASKEFTKTVDEFFKLLEKAV